MLHERLSNRRTTTAIALIVLSLVLMGGFGEAFEADCSATEPCADCADCAAGQCEREQGDCCTTCCVTHAPLALAAAVAAHGSPVVTDVSLRSAPAVTGRSDDGLYRPPRG